METKTYSKRIILSLIVSFSVLFAYGQNSVGIGTTTPDTNAVLHLVSPSGKQGILIPKVSIATITTYGAAQTGMMVFDTPSNKFYYWDGSAWVAMGGSNSDAWKTTGNAGLTNLNYVGTSDNVSMRFRTNNIERMVIDSVGKIVVGKYLTGLQYDIQLGRENQSVTSGVGVYSNVASQFPMFALVKYRGTQTAPLAIQNNDYIGAFGFRGYNGTMVRNAGSIFMDASENWSGTSNGAYMSFNTTSNGSLTPVERMRIHSNGNIGISSTNPISNLQIGRYLHLDTLNISGLNYNMYANNIRYNGTGFEHTINGLAALMYLGGSEAGIELHPTAGAGVQTNPNTTFRLNNSGFEFQFDSDSNATFKFGDNNGDFFLQLPDTSFYGYSWILPKNPPVSDGQILSTKTNGELYWSNGGTGADNDWVDNTTHIYNQNADVIIGSNSHDNTIKTRIESGTKHTGLYVNNYYYVDGTTSYGIKTTMNSSNSTTRFGVFSQAGGFMDNGSSFGGYFESNMGGAWATNKALNAIANGSGYNYGLEIGSYNGEFAYGISSNVTNSTQAGYGFSNNVNISDTAWGGYGIQNSLNLNNTSATGYSNYNYLWATNGSTGSLYGNYSIIYRDGNTSSGTTYGDYIYAVNNAGASGQIYGSNITVDGGSTGSPSYGLYVNAYGSGPKYAAYFAQGRVYVQDTIVIPTGAAPGKVLTSDASGNASWQNAGGGSWTVSGNNMYSSLTGNVGIGTSTPDATIHTVGTNAGIFSDYSITTYSGGGKMYPGAYYYSSILGAGGSWSAPDGGGLPGAKFIGGNGGPSYGGGGAGIVAIGGNGSSYGRSGAGIYARAGVDGISATDGVPAVAGYFDGNSTGHAILAMGGNVGIGTITPSTTLDVVSDGGAILIPRKSTAGDPTGTNGMIYYNSNMAKFRVFENGTWKDWIASGSSSGWSLTGNAGTVDGTNYIGTSDNIPLTFKVNGQISGKIQSTIPATTSFGYLSLQSVTGSYNTAFGYSSSSAVTSGSANTSMGYSSLSSNSTGANNTAIGFQSMLSSTGNDNTAVGYMSLSSQTSGYSNSALGLYSLGSNTSGYYNTAMGNYASYGNVSSGLTTSMGYNALYSNKAGNFATAVGAYAMQYSNNTATSFNSYNTAVGYEALRGSATASANTGNFNTSVGHQSGYSFTSGGQNTYLGYQSGYSNTSNSNNTMIGYMAGKSTTGTTNTFIGAGTGFNVTGGGRNTYLGSNAGYSNANGSFNTFVGDGAGYFATSGDRNILIGYGSGGNTSGGIGNYNTYIGDMAKGALGISNSSAFGVNAIVNQSNSMVLGDTVNNRVGIGTSKPSTKLHIVGGNLTTLRIVDGNQGNNKVLTSDANGNAYWANAVSPNIYTADGTLGSARIVTHNDNDLVYHLSGSGAANFQVRNASGFNAIDVEGDGDVNFDNGTMFVDQANNRVGIGTTGPQATLHITNASPRFTLTNSAVNTTSGTQLSEIWFNDGVTSNPQAGIRVFRDGAVSGDAPTAMAFYTTSTGSLSNTERMRINKDGFVGIGLNPTYPLHVSGNIKTEGYIYVGSSSTQYLFGVAGSYMGVSDHFIPNNTNIQDLGTSSWRWRNIYTYDVNAINEYNYSTAKTHYLAVSASEFVPMTSSLDYSVVNFERYFSSGVSTNLNYMFAPIHLPDGATIGNTIFYVYDADGTTNQISCDIMVYNTPGRSASNNPGSSTTGAPGNTTISVNPGLLVDNVNNNYFLRIRMLEINSNHRIAGARVAYTVTKAD